MRERQSGALKRTLQLAGPGTRVIMAFLHQVPEDQAVQIWYYLRYRGMSDDLKKMNYPENFLDTVRVFQTERQAPEKFMHKLLEVYDNGHFAEYAKELNLEIDTVVDLVRIAGPDVAAMNHWLDTANYLVVR